MRVVVQQPYLDLHTGPGRGYPVFHSLPQGETLELIKRRTQWFKVRDKKGVTGWVNEADIDTTLTLSGSELNLASKNINNYLKQQFAAGFSGGYFSGDPQVAAYLGYRLTRYLSAELFVAEVIGDFATTDLGGARLVMQFMPDERISPHFNLGFGHYKSAPRGTLVQDQPRANNFYQVGLGVRYYITRQFFSHLDARRYLFFVDDNRNDEHSEFSVGFSFFF